MKTSVLAGVAITSLIFLAQASGVPRFDDGIRHRFSNDEMLSQNIEKLTEGTVTRVCGKENQAIVTATVTISGDKKTAWVKVVINDCNNSQASKDVRPFIDG
jgi:hypothetical protein